VEADYDDANRRTGAELANGVTSVFDFDVNNRLEHIQHAKDATALFEVAFGHDEVGTKLFARDSTPGVTGRSELYDHDARRRLRSMQRGVLNAEGTAITPLADTVMPSAESWPDLDRRGNWPTFTRTVNGTATIQARTANGANEYLTLDPDTSDSEPALTLTHDANGNLTSDPTGQDVGMCKDGECPCAGGHAYGYDEENRLVDVQRMSNMDPLLWNGYDALGRRVETFTFVEVCGQEFAPSATRHVYSGLNVIEEYTDGSTSPVLAREFVWGRQFPEPVAMIDHTTAGDLPEETAEVLHYLRGALGSVVALTNAAGAVVERYVYDPYGRTYILAPDGTKRVTSEYGNPFMWTGQRYDATVGLYHFWARTYSPGLGRWLQRDPLGYVDGVNLYEYVGGNPACAIDPLGLAGLDCLPELVEDIEQLWDDAIAWYERFLAAQRAAQRAARLAALVNASVATVEAVAATGTSVLVTSAAVEHMKDATNSALGYRPRFQYGPTQERPRQAYNDHFVDDYKEHRKGKRKSTEQKHAKGDKRRDMDNWGEKGDKRRPYRRKGIVPPISEGPGDGGGEWPPPGNGPPRLPPPDDDDDDQ